ncbi:MAG: BatD family protein [Bacillota bacterium]
MIGKTYIFKFSFIILILISISMFAVQSSYASSPEFQLDIDNLNLQKGVSTNIVLTLTNARGAEIVEIEGLDNFDVISERQSTSTRISNGEINYQEKKTYLIIPLKTGDLTLQAKIKYNGKIYQSNRLQIKVEEKNEDNNEKESDMFIKTNVSDTDIYIGQKIILTYDLYSRHDVRNFSFQNQVSVDDFLNNEIEQDDIEANYTYHNGKRYMKFALKKVYLTPLKTGNFKIPSYNVQVNIMVDGGLFGTVKPMYLETDSKELTVRSLPENKPDDFSGIVGELDISAKYSRKEIEYGDSITLNVIVSGNSNLDNINKIMENEIPGFSVYETEKDSQESVQNGEYYNKKEFEIILVPEKTGEITIDPIEISYFDTVSESYKVAAISGADITVTGQVPQTASAFSPENTSLETVRIEQISYPEEDQGYLIVKLNRNILRIVIVFLVVLIGIIVIIYAINFYRKRRNRELANIYREMKKADQKDKLYELVNKMISYKYGLSLKAASREMIRKKIDDKDLVDDIIDFMDSTVNAKYQPHIDSANIKGKAFSIYKKIKDSKCQ